MKTTTAIYRRWNTDKKAYVDSKNIPLPREPPTDFRPAIINRSGADPAKPPVNGSAPFLTLPTELRLQIYGYLTEGERGIEETIGSPFACYDDVPGTAIKPAPSTTYSYLYRSPGRATKPNAIPLGVVRLFHINHSIREELLDSCFADRTFVLEASLYARSVGGLDVVPSRLGMSAWVKRLLLITVLDRETGAPKGIADLRPLQELTNLKELRIIFRALAPVDPLRVANSPIRAVISCVPRMTKVFIGVQSDVMEEGLLAELGASLQYLFTDNADAIACYDRLNANMDELTADMGTMSGSRANHGACVFPTCREQHLGRACTNARTPGALPFVPETPRVASSGAPVSRCGLKTMDGRISHVHTRSAGSPEELVKTFSKTEHETQPDGGNWGASVQRTRRRWSTWGGRT